MRVNGDIEVLHFLLLNTKKKKKKLKCLTIYFS